MFVSSEYCVISSVHETTNFVLFGHFKLIGLKMFVFAKHGHLNTV